ncbi:hypothetical protein EPN16_00490 [bacterium]|nr:MAG: hypothetical protein EPN16_00490 [bacterium]
MEYRIDKDGLMDRLSAWNDYLKRRVRLIACGGTALTLLNIKGSTKDIDLLVPDVKEHEYLVTVLKQLGYQPKSGWGLSRDDGFIFDLFRGKAVHTTELLDSPLDKDKHIFIKEFSRIYLGILNYYDLIISKLFRASAVDLQDCLILFKSKRGEINLKYLEKRFYETASYDVSEGKVIKNWKHFLKLIETA